MRTGKGWCPFATQIEGVTTFVTGGMARVGFCDHTAGGFYSTLTTPSFWNNQGVSVHFAVSRKGDIAQIINIFDTAFAQGKLGPTVSWPRYNFMSQVNPNMYLISTEHEDAETIAGKTVFVPGSEWTSEQYAADLRIKRWCIDELKKYNQNGMVFGIDSLTGHHMFDNVNRAECPGKFWREHYRQQLYTDLTQESEMFVRWGGEANPSFWNNHQISGPQGWDVRSDYNLPPEVVDVEFEAFVKSGSVTFHDGGSTGRVGFLEGPGVNHFRIKLDSNGAAWMEGNAVIDKLVCLGYYT